MTFKWPVGFAGRAPVMRVFRRDMVIALRMVFVGVVTGLATGIAAAQTTGELPLHIGDRIRIRTLASSTVTKGTLVAADAAAFTLAPEGRDTSHRKFTRSEIVELEVARGRKSHWLPGALVGAGAAFVGALAMCSDSFCSTDETDDTTKNAAVAAGIGGAIGGLVGLLIRSDRWTTVPPDRLRVAVSPVRGQGVALTVGVSY